MDQKGLNLSQPVVKDYESIGGKKTALKEKEIWLLVHSQGRQVQGKWWFLAMKACPQPTTLETLQKKGQTHELKGLLLNYILWPKHLTVANPTSII